MSQRPLSVVIVGGGIIGRHHAEAVARHPRLRVAAVVDPVAEARDRLTAQIGADTGGPAPAGYAELAVALAQTEADVVVVCTPSGLHAEGAAAAIEAGCHVVVEKPLDSSLSRARRLVGLAARAQARGQVCTVISQHRFDPAHAAVADAVASGRFGRITSAVASVAWWRDQSYYDSARWRGTWAFDGGGALMNQGIHAVDLLVWLLGRPVEVVAHTGLLAHERIDVEDVATASVRFASGALATLHATTAAYPGLTVRLQVHGSDGSAVVDDDQLGYFHSALDQAAGNQAAAVVPPGDLRGAAKPEDGFLAGHLRQYHDIVDAIDHGRPPLVTVAEAFTAMAVVKAVYLSAALRAPVAVDDVLAGGFDGEPVA